MMRSRSLSTSSPRRKSYGEGRRVADSEYPPWQMTLASFFPQVVLNFEQWKKQRENKETDEQSDGDLCEDVADCPHPRAPDNPYRNNNHEPQQRERDESSHRVMQQFSQP